MKKTDLSLYNNAWYSPGSNVFKRLVWYYVNLIFIRSGFLPLNAAKIFLLRAFGARVGRNVTIKPGVSIKYPWFLSVGNNVWIGENVWIDNLTTVTISDNCCLSQGAMLLTGNHNYKKSTFDLMIGEIHLEEGVWIGTQSIVCPGVRCKSHAVLTVGSVASKDLETFGIYRGNPAVHINTREIN